MVDDNGRLTAVIDWECVSAVPLWRSYQLPALFDERTREEKPNKETYAADLDEDDAEDDDGLDNEDITDLYWELLLEYEMTQLRKMFLSGMQHEQPDWVTVMRNSSLKADFEKAVHHCDNGMASKIIKRWIDALLLGDVRSLSAELGY